MENKNKVICIFCEGYVIDDECDCDYRHLGRYGRFPLLESEWWLDDEE